jgi:hypothetical protein
VQQQYLFNAGWSSKHEQYIAAQLQQQVDTVFSGNSQKVKKYRFKKVTTGLMQLYVRTKQIPAVGAQAVG